MSHLVDVTAVVGACVTDITNFMMDLGAILLRRDPNTVRLSLLKALAN
jgi:hypothetical protein